MNKRIVTRVNEISDYIEETKCTIRDAAKKFGISKSTVHKDMTERLLGIDSNKYKIIDQIFQKHLEIRHIKGGESTKNKYLKLKQET